MADSKPRTHKLQVERSHAAAHLQGNQIMAQKNRRAHVRQMNRTAWRKEHPEDSRKQLHDLTFTD
jgi:hypothetical protein